MVVGREIGTAPKSAPDFLHLDPRKPPGSAMHKRDKKMEIAHWHRGAAPYANGRD
jgi:hypothetical protein